MYCISCGQQIQPQQRFCANCGAAVTEAGAAPQIPTPEAAPGWYPDPTGQGQRWWNGQAWGQPAPAQPVPPTVLPVREKSAGLALLFTILWPGAGQMYLGFGKQGTPFVVANAVGFVLGLTGVLLPIGIVIWFVTLVMTVGKINEQAEYVNAELRAGRRVTDA